MLPAEDASGDVGDQRSFTDRSRHWRVVLALLGGGWALVTLPLVAADWAWPWVRRISSTAFYEEIAGLVGDPYIAFGAAGLISFAAIGLALMPSLRRAGWGGTILGWVVLAGAVVTLLSYLGTPVSSPLHALWGAEILVLLLMGITGVIAAFTAGRHWAAWARVLLGSTVVVLFAGAAVFGYYPHGCLVFFGLEAMALILAAPSDPEVRAVGIGASRSARA